MQLTIRRTRFTHSMPLLALITSMAFMPTAWSACNANSPATTPSSDFTVHNDGTVTHLTTGLMWKVCSEGQAWSSSVCSGSATTHTWDNALQIPQSVNVGGGYPLVGANYTDWRLPNLKELQSITELMCFRPTINESIFPDTVSGRYWSSSPAASGSNAWWVSFNGGSAYNYFRKSASNDDRDSSYWVRLVRSASGKEFKNNIDPSSNDLNLGLVAHYKFEGDAVNSSGLALDGVAMSSVSYSEGKFGLGAVFGGVDNPSHIFVPNSSALQFTQGATYSAWVRVDALKAMDGWGRTITTSGGGAVFAKSHDRRGAAFHFHINDDSIVSTYIQTYETWARAEANTVVEWPREKYVGDWTFITYTLSSTEKSRIYIDGKFIFESNAPAEFSRMNNEALYIGKFSDSWYPFYGTIDDLRIYNRVLSESEITELFQAVD